MSALDRALIKAYRRQHGDASIAEPQSMFPSTVPDARSFHPAEQVVAGPHRRAISTTAIEPASTDQAASSGAGWTTFRVDVGVVGLSSGPSYLSSSELDPESKSAPSEAIPMVAAEAESPHAEPHSQRSQITAEAAPPTAVHLTSRMPTPVAAEETTVEPTLPTVVTAATLQPQLVVDRFDWPALCDDLCESGHKSWHAFLETWKGHRQSHRTFGFVGTESGTGCTTVLLCIARQLAATGKRVAIVDANFSKPGLAELLSVNVANGWDAALAGKLALDETLIESLDDHITLVPLAAGEVRRTAKTTSAHAPRFWQSLEESFDVVLFDAGSLDLQPCEELKVLCDSMPMPSMYLVCDCRSTTPQEMVGVAKEFKDHGMNLLGTIENYNGTAVGKHVP